ncbi:MAG: hypothetical protein LBM99_04260 [Bacillales bacterium]|nr:hypothetical protein [Bacillales bacterium]
MKKRTPLAITLLIFSFLSLIFATIFGPADNLLSPNVWYSSISSTYYTNGRDIFVSLASILAILFFLYQTNKTEKILNIIIGIACIGVICFPTFANTDKVGVFQLNPNTSKIIHAVFAVIVFVFMGIEVFFFALKEKLNIMYFLSSIIFVCCLGFLFIEVLNFPIFLRSVFEIILFACFSSAWFILEKKNMLNKNKI